MRSVQSATCFMLAMLAVPFRTVMAQQDSSAKPAKGAYSAEQATRGGDVYLDQCSACHLPKDHYNPDFQQSWGGRTVRALYDYIRSTMPDDSPGVLTEKQYLDVTAYILKLNGMPAGELALTADTTLMKSFTIDIKPKTTGLSLLLRRRR
jgi:mono/diheme cytochrome c family protein